MLTTILATAIVATSCFAISFALSALGDAAKWIGRKLVSCRK